MNNLNEVLKGLETAKEGTALIQYLRHEKEYFEEMIALKEKEMNEAESVTERFQLFQEIKQLKGGK